MTPIPIYIEDPRATLVTDIWEYIKSIGADKSELGIDISLEDIEHSVFASGNELRVSGEEHNDFSIFYVCYSEAGQEAQGLIDYLLSLGWRAEWYNSAYLIVKREERQVGRDE